MPTLVTVVRRRSCTALCKTRDRRTRGACPHRRASAASGERSRSRLTWRTARTGSKSLGSMRSGSRRHCSTRVSAIRQPIVSALASPSPGLAGSALVTKSIRHVAPTQSRRQSRRSMTMAGASPAPADELQLEEGPRQASRNASASSVITLPSPRVRVKRPTRVVGSAIGLPTPALWTVESKEHGSAWIEERQPRLLSACSRQQSVPAVEPVTGPRRPSRRRVPPPWTAGCSHRRHAGTMLRGRCSWRSTSTRCGSGPSARAT